MYLVISISYLSIIVIDKLIITRDKQIRKYPVEDLVNEVNYLFNKLLVRWIIYYNKIYDKVFLLGKDSFSNTCSWISLLILIGILIVVFNHGL